MLIFYLYFRSKSKLPKDLAKYFCTLATSKSALKYLHNLKLMLLVCSRNIF